MLRTRPFTTLRNSSGPTARLVHVSPIRQIIALRQAPGGWSEGGPPHDRLSSASAGRIRARHFGAQSGCASRAQLRLASWQPTLKVPAKCPRTTSTAIQLMRPRPSAATASRGICIGNRAGARFSDPRAAAVPHRFVFDLGGLEGVHRHTRVSAARCYRRGSRWLVSCADRLPTAFQLGVALRAMPPTMRTPGLDPLAHIAWRDGAARARRGRRSRARIASSSVRPAVAHRSRLHV